MSYSNSVKKFEDIPSYYFDSGLIDNMTQNTFFKSISTEKFIKKNSEKIRDDSEIVDFDDFLYALACMSFWLVEELPKIIYDYMDKHLNEDVDYKTVEYYCNTGDFYHTYYPTIREYIILKKGYKYVSCADNYYLGLKNEGNLVGFENSPELPEGKFKKVLSYRKYSVALKESGEFVVFGQTTDRFVRRNALIPPEGKFVDFEMGEYFVVSMRENGEVVTWGSNSDDQLENSPTTEQFIKISCGPFHTVGIKKDLSLKFWGNEEDDLNNFPRGKFKDVQCSNYCTMLIDTDGNAYSCTNGIIRKIEGDFIKVLSGDNYSIGLEKNGDLYDFSGNREKKITSKVKNIYGSYKMFCYTQENGDAQIINFFHLNAFYTLENKSEQLIDFFFGNYYCIALKDDCSLYRVELPKNFIYPSIF